MYVGDVITVILTVPILAGLYWAIGKTHVDPLTGARHSTTRIVLSPGIKFLLGVGTSLCLAILLALWAALANIMGAEVPNFDEQLPDVTHDIWINSGLAALALTLMMLAGVVIIMRRWRIR